MSKVALFLRNLTSSLKVTFVLQNFDRKSNKMFVMNDFLSSSEISSGETSIFVTIFSKIKDISLTIIILKI